MVNLVRLPTLKERTGLSRSTIYAKIKEGSFPAPIRLGARAVAWVEDDVSGWIEQVIAESRQGGESNE